MLQYIYYGAGATWLMNKLNYINSFAEKKKCLYNFEIKYIQHYISVIIAFDLTRL
jgi:hypothetical protein